jgi:hypothetical protein
VGLNQGHQRGASHGRPHGRIVARMTDTPPPDRPFDANKAAASDPTLRRVGDSIEDARESAREIFGERDEDGETTTVNDAAADGDDAGKDIGGSAPLP